jgi:hypothetical protein
MARNPLASTDCSRTQVGFGAHDRPWPETGQSWLLTYFAKIGVFLHGQDPKPTLDGTCLD